MRMIYNYYYVHIYVHNYICIILRINKLYFLKIYSMIFLKIYFIKKFKVCIKKERFYNLIFLKLNSYHYQKFKEFSL